VILEVSRVNTRYEPPVEPDPIASVEPAPVEPEPVPVEPPPPSIPMHSGPTIEVRVVEVPQQEEYIPKVPSRANPYLVRNAGIILLFTVVITVSMVLLFTA